MAYYFKVPKEPSTKNVLFSRVEPGEYLVEIAQMIVHSDEKLAVQYRILEEGEFQGMPLPENFVTTFGACRRRLEDFAAAIGVPITDEGIDTEACMGKRLCVRVVHAGKWDNVVSHRPEF